MRPALALLALLLLPASASAVQLLADGGHGGVSEPLPRLPMAAQVSERLPAGWTRSAVEISALRVDGGWVLPRAGGLAALAPAPAPDGGAGLPMLLAEDWLLVAWPPEVASELLAELGGLDPTAPPPETLIAAAAADATRLHLGVAGPPPPVPAPVVSGEARLQVTWTGPDGAELHLVSRARGEGARRLAEQRRRDTGDALRLVAGDAVEGRSFLAGQSLSLQRDVSWAAMRREGVDALVPAHLELLAGLETLKEEARAAGIELVSSNLRAGGEPALAPYAVFERDDARVLVLGWTRPAALAGLDPALSAAGPEAVLEALATARAREEFDLVVLVGLGPDLPDLPGIDLALVDWGGDRRREVTWTAPQELLTARRAMPPASRDPLPTPRLGRSSFLDARVTMEDGAIRAATLSVVPVSEDLPPDAEVRREVQDVRQGVYIERQDVLVPDPGSLQAPPGWRKGAVRAEELDAAGFALLAGNLMVERTGADIAMVPVLPTPLDIDGDRSELVVDSALALVDDVVRVTVTGLELRQILLSFPLVQATPGAGSPPADGAWLVGAQVALFPRWRGQKLGDGDWIQIAMSDRLLADPRIAALLTKARVVETWRGDGWVRRSLPGGERWPLRELVRDGLVRLRAKDPTFGARYGRRLVPLTSDLAERVPSRLSLEVDALNLGVSGSLSFKPETAYETSNESRAKLANSLALAMRGRIALRWSDRIGEIEGFVMGNYAGSREEGLEEPIELTDDLLLGGEVQLRLGGAGQRLTKVPLSLYLQSVFDTEVSPADDPDDPSQKLPRQKLLRTSGGLALGWLGVIREAWVGGFLEADLAAEVGTFSPGVTAGVRTYKAWGVLRWSNLLDLRGYFPTDADTAADLSLRLGLRSDLVVLPLRKIVPGLGVGGFVDALLFRGSIPGLNTTPGVHLLVGAEITYDTVIRPPLRVF